MNKTERDAAFEQAGKLLQEMEQVIYKGGSIDPFIVVTLATMAMGAIPYLPEAHRAYARRALHRILEKLPAEFGKLMQEYWSIHEKIH